MKDNNLPDERVVYLALKNVFKGPDAEMRRLAAVRKLITKRQKDSGVADLVNAHNIETVCNMARTLLTEGIFESTLKAKIRFPEVFDVSPAQSAEREASEAEAAINDANAIKGAVEGHSEDLGGSNSRADVTETESVETCHNAEPTVLRHTNTVPSLFPVYLPIRTQHRILTKVQSILEDACFDFGQRRIPDVLKRNQWDCSEAAELNLWSKELMKRQNELFHKAVDTGKPLDKLLSSIADLRHTAVHRICISARGLEQFLLNAESFVVILGDTTRLKLLTEIRRNIQQTIEELERNKHLLTSKLQETLKRIAAQRAELDRMEEIALADMMREDGEYQEFAGRSLEVASVSSEARAPISTAKDGESSSTIDEADVVEQDAMPEAKVITYGFTGFNDS
ncbi:hypothetical protein F5Y03DRAFT_353907 [Xylaria venustula]|nr:hypothetical protein F5Y03DRAFT_353907 [Xylaria venustula]